MHARGLMLAGLAGLGASALAHDLSFALAIPLWAEWDLLVSDAGRPHFEVLLLPAFALGAFVSFRLGGSRATLALGGVVLLSTLGVLPLSWLWSFAGIALGVSAAWLRPGPVPFHRVLEVVGIYHAGVLALQVAFIMWQAAGAQPPPWEVGTLFTRSAQIVLGTFAGVMIVRRAGMPPVSAVAFIVALPSAVVLLYQGWMLRFDGFIGLISSGGGLFVASAILIGAIGDQLWSHRRSRAGRARRTERAAV